MTRVWLCATLFLGGQSLLLAELILPPIGALGGGVVTSNSFNTNQFISVGTVSIREDGKLTNAHHFGTLELTNPSLPGVLRLRNADGGYTSFQIPSGFIPSNKVSFAISNTAMGDLLSVSAVSSASGVHSITLTSGGGIPVAVAGTNFYPAGLFYFDPATAPYTNHDSSGLNYTNLASYMLREHSLTNLGSSFTATWRGRFRGANDGTNQLIAGFGSVTNALGDTGQFTNRANAAWQFQAKVTTTGPTNHYAYWRFDLGGATTFSGNMTNFQTRAFATGIVTNGVTNIIGLQARGFGAGAITNDYFDIEYQPGIR